MKSSPSTRATRLASAGLLALALAPAWAQQSGLVNVNVSQIPVTVQVPVGVAATVCGVAANVLGQQAASGNAQCTANTTSTALDQIVQNQLKGTGQR